MSSQPANRATPVHGWFFLLKINKVTRLTEYTFYVFNIHKFFPIQSEEIMSKGLIYAILAPIFYALANVILEHKFSKHNNLTLIIIYGTVILVLAVLLREATKTTDPSFEFPQGNTLLTLVGLGVIFFAADYFFIGAYTNGTDLLTITCLTVLFPVFASLFKFAGSYFIPEMNHVMPNAWQISGYVLAAIAALLVVQGNLVK